MCQSLMYFSIKGEDALSGVISPPDQIRLYQVEGPTITPHKPLNMKLIIGQQN